MAELFRYYLDTPERRRIVTIVTLVLGLATLWPAVDEYSAKSAEQAQLTEELQKVQKTVSGLREAEQDAYAQQQNLQQLEAMCVTEEKLTFVRGRLVELARSCGCQLRQCHPGQAKETPWKPGDDPFDVKPGPQTNVPKVGYFLRSQEVSLSLSGKLANTKEFLNKLAGLGLLIHARQVTIANAATTDKEVILDLMLVLCDLQRREAAPG